MEWLAKLKKNKIRLDTTKSIISQSRTQRLWIVSVHFIPVLAITIIAAINLEGYFIGTTFVGVGDTKFQSLVLLALQITAKILEITVIASLGLIVLDIVHHFLISNDTGLPLALSGIKLTFTSLFYLVSPSFWFGINALGSKYTRISIAFLLISCGLLANFVGPAAALLLIPLNNSQWPAGGLRFRVPQNTSQIWPLKLNASNIGGLDCLNPSEAMLNIPPANYSRCIWYGTTMLGSDLGGDLPWSGNETLDDLGQFYRHLSWTTYNFNNFSPVQWSWSSMSLANVLSSLLLYDWELAANGTKATKEASPGNDVSSWNFLSRYSRYSHRDPWGTQAELTGMLGPIARASCQGQWRDFNDTEPLAYPVIPLYGNHYDDTNATYMIKTDLVPKTPDIRMSWTPRPTGKVQMAHAQGHDAEQFPSAFLHVQFPLNSTTAGVVFACSVDARWTNMTTTFDAFNDMQVAPDGTPPTFSRYRDTTFDNDGRPIIGQTSLPVHLDIPWLDVLTPFYNWSGSGTSIGSNRKGYNIYSAALNPIPRNVTKEDLNYWMWLTALNIEGFTTTIVVDGMSRFNFEEHWHGQFHNLFEHWSWNASSDLSVLLAGGGGLTKPAPDLSTSTEFLWTITISGYAYYANSTASMLALAVLLSYVIFAFGHIFFTLYKRWTSLAWTSVAEIIALSQNSPQSPLIRNTAGGIDSKYTSRLLLKLRAPNTPEKDEERLHILVSKGQEELGYREAVGYHKIVNDRGDY